MKQDRDQEVEKLVVAKGLTAPRITASDVEDMIENVTFTVLPSGKCTVCEITLKNAWTVTGTSSVVSIENFDQKIGEEIAYDEARDKIWPFLGFSLQENLYRAPAQKVLKDITQK